MAAKPHLVVFNPDSYRGDVLGHLGKPGAVTPALDAVMADGAVSFANAFAQNPVCTPSRCSYMTGWYPHTHGHRSMKNMLKPHEPNLLKVLRNEGYHVWWGGKNDLVAAEKPEDFMLHCDEHHQTKHAYRGYAPPPDLPAEDPRSKVFYQGVMQRDPEAEYTDRDRNRVEAAIEKVKFHDPSQPLCLFLPLTWPHPAYRVEKEFYDLIDPDLLPPRLPVSPNADRQPPLLDALRQAFEADRVTEEDWKEIKRVYYAMCAKIDHLFGQLVEGLKSAGIYDDTLLVFLSDHGDFAGDYSLPEKTHGTLQDALIRVPLVFKLPADMPVRPGVRRQLVELVDMPATLYDLLGIDPGYHCQGRSLGKVLEDPHAPHRDAVFAEVGSRPDDRSFHNNDAVTRRPGSFYERQSRAARPFAVVGSYAVSCRTNEWKYVRRGYTEYHELYDLEKDPGELHNLYGRPEAAEIQRQMELRLLDYFMQTGDVLPYQQDPRGG